MVSFAFLSSMLLQSLSFLATILNEMWTVYQYVTKAPYNKFLAPFETCNNKKGFFIFQTLLSFLKNTLINIPVLAYTLKEDSFFITITH